MTTNFKQRLQDACDDSTIVPEHGKGRQVAIANRLKVTQEAVRKWFAGEAVPRPAKMRELAEFLEVDEPWLALGIKPELDRHEKRANLMNLNGAVHLVAGLIMLEGGNCAFPGDRDPRREWVDLYAIMRGSQFAIHVSLALELTPGMFSIKIPRNFSDVKCIGVVGLGGGKFHFLSMNKPILEDHKLRRAGDYFIPVSKADNRYYTGSTVIPRFKTFGELHD